MTSTQVDAAIEITKAVADAIRALKDVPSGVLYARLMGHMTLAQYESIIAVLKRGGLVREHGYVLTWVGK